MAQSIPLPLRIDRESGVPYQHQIADQLERFIFAGLLKPGDRLPSLVELADSLAVSKNTVLGAFDKLSEVGFIQGLRGRGFFVSADGRALTAVPPVSAPASAQPALTPDWLQQGSGVHIDPPAAPVRHDFKVGRPSADAFPYRLWSRLSSELLRYAPGRQSMTEYVPACGLWGLRMHIADYLGVAKAIRVEPEQVIVVAGIQEALSLLAGRFLGAGSVALAETPCYSGFYNLPELHRAKIRSVGVDDDGLRTDDLPLLAASPGRRAPLVYVTPAHQYPLGYTLSLARRRALLAWAERNGAYVVEDDCDGDFRYEEAPLPSLMALGGGNVIHLGTFSKVLGPGLRLGYMVCPPDLVEEMARRKALLNNACPSLDQAVMARFFEDNNYARHLHGLRRRYREQRDCLVAGLRRLFGADCRISGEQAGMHLALHLPAWLPSARDVARTAMRCGVRVYTLSESASTVEAGSDLDDRVLLFGYAALPTASIEDALGRLALAVDQLR